MSSRTGSTAFWPWVLATGWSWFCPYGHGLLWIFHVGSETSKGLPPRMATAGAHEGTCPCTAQKGRAIQVTMTTLFPENLWLTLPGETGSKDRKTPRSLSSHVRRSHLPDLSDIWPFLAQSLFSHSHQQRYPGGEGSPLLLSLSSPPASGTSRIIQ